MVRGVFSDSVIYCLCSHSGTCVWSECTPSPRFVYMKPNASALADQEVQIDDGAP